MRANTTQRRTGTSQRIRDETAASSHYSQRRARNFLADPYADFKGDVSTQSPTAAPFSDHAPALPELNFSHSYAVEELHFASRQDRAETENHNPVYEHPSEPASERRMEYLSPVSEDREESHAEPSQELEPPKLHDAPRERAKTSRSSPHPISRDKQKRRKKAAQRRSRAEVKKQEQQEETAQSVSSQPVSETNTADYPIESDTVAPVEASVSAPVESAVSPPRETVSHDTLHFECPSQPVLDEKPPITHERKTSTLHTARQESPAQDNPTAQKAVSSPRRFQPAKDDGIPKPAVLSAESARSAAVHDRTSELRHDSKEAVHQTAPLKESPKGKPHSKDAPTQDRPKGRSKLQFTTEELPQKEGNSPKGQKQSKESPKGQRKNPSASSQAKAAKSTPKGRSKLRFRAEEVAAPVQTAAHTAGRAGKSALHRKISESEQENSGVQAAHQTELAREAVIRTTGKLHSARAERKATAQRSTRLHHARVNRQSEESKKKQAQKQAMKHSQQKKRAADAYQKARSKTEKLGEHVQNILAAVLELVAEKKHALFMALGLLLTLIAMLSMFTSCSAVFVTAVDAFLQTTWLSEDEDINKADIYYSKLEAELQRKIGRTASLHPNFDEYRFELDDIGHDPVELISYLSASSENGIFVYNSALEDRLDAIFAEQYLLDVDESTEAGTVTRTVRVGESIGNVVTSAYCNCAICCGQWAGSPTESGVMPTANHTLAVDLYDPIVPMGTQLVINGILYKVEDTGYLNRYGVNFDVYMDSHETAQMWGHKTFEAFLYDANGSNTVTVTETSTRKVIKITLKKKSFDQLAHDDLNLIAEEQYQLYKESGGNRAFLSAPSVYDWKTRVDKNYGYRCGATNAITLNHGVELSLRSGSWVFGGFDGTVTQVGSNADLGTYVTIQNEKYTATYGHLGSVSVSRGQSVLAGDRLGKVGGQPLYVEFLYDGEYYNPCLYLQTGTY